LQRAADALGCDLVYALVPRQPLEQIVAGRARDVSRDQLARVDHSDARGLARRQQSQNNLACGAIRADAHDYEPLLRFVRS
jgi:hypothetical protein